MVSCDHRGEGQWQGTLRQVYVTKCALPTTPPVARARRRCVKTGPGLPIEHVVVANGDWRYMRGARVGRWRLC